MDLPQTQASRAISLGNARHAPIGLWLFVGAPVTAPGARGKKLRIRDLAPQTQRARGLRGRGVRPAARWIVWPIWLPL